MQVLKLACLLTLERLSTQEGQYDRPRLDAAISALQENQARFFTVTLQGMVLDARSSMLGAADAIAACSFPISQLLSSTSKLLLKP